MSLHYHKGGRRLHANLLCVFTQLSMPHAIVDYTPAFTARNVTGFGQTLGILGWANCLLLLALDRQNPRGQGHASRQSE